MIVKILLGPLVSGRLYLASVVLSAKIQCMLMLSAETQISFLFVPILNEGPT